MRAPAGAIAAVPAGQRFARSVLAEAAAAAAACGHPVPTGPLHVTEQALTAPGSSATSSLTRDLIAGRRTGVEAVLADLAARARAAGTATPLIDLAVLALRIHNRQSDLEHRGCVLLVRGCRTPARSEKSLSSERPGCLGP